VSSRLGSGTSFIIHLPSSTGSLLEQTVLEPRTGPTKSSRILLMDDDESILEVTSELLRHLGHIVECAADRGAALQAYEQNLHDGHPFDLVIMDLTVPGGMGGREAVAHLLVMDPEASAIISSGYSDNLVMANYGQYGFKGVMPKPYHIEEMSSEIERVLSTKRTPGSSSGSTIL
jgi:two-component system cell cycle sensor histidine kinase/response regulator CckA